MKDDKPQTLGAVVFFERNDEGTFDTTGRTQVMPYSHALDVYANTPNPASQIVGGNTEEEVEMEVTLMIYNMMHPKYVEEYVDPYL